MPHTPIPIPAVGTEISATRPGPPHGHHCGARWGGLKTSHCSACHQTFTGMTAFDKHRTGAHPLATRHCLDPATVGLVDANRAYPCWGLPGERDDL